MAVLGSGCHSPKIEDSPKTPETQSSNTAPRIPQPFRFTVDLEQFYRQTVCDDDDNCRTFLELGKKLEIPIHIPVIQGAKVMYDLDCDGDGRFEHIGLTSSTVCTYEKKDGKVQISIQGDLPGLRLCGDDAYGGETGFANNYAPVSIDQWGDIAWKTFKSFAHHCRHLTIEAKDAPNLKDVRDMSAMFANASALNQPLEHWDVSHVENMAEMFSEAEKFNQPLAKWNVSSVKNMKGMFAAAFEFNQPLETWEMSGVEDTSFMFHAATSFNQPLASWKVSNVKNMSGMFTDAVGFNQPLNTWDVSNVTDMSGMFRGASAFNQPLNAWDVSNVTLMDGMFNRAVAFNQSLETWNVKKVIDMSAMFWGASAFLQDLNTWQITSVQRKNDMFYQSGMKSLPSWYK